MKSEAVWPGLLGLQEGHSNFCQPQWQLHYPWQLQQICSLFLIQESDNHLQRMGKEKLLKLHPGSFSYGLFKTFTIHSGKIWSNYFNTLKFQIKSLQKLRNFCL